MDDSCAVCAETLQWAAYGPCGHREVCSTCVVRMRFVCEDLRCCLCKRESGIIFITKALGDFTRMRNDFTIFPADPKEGQVGAYWYHEGTQAFFDDVDHYKMIKAMCKLSSSACGDGSKWNFRNVELLKNHLAQRHRLSMCTLCLEGRKAFICEQKLYTEAQLDRHIKTGDSEVDGSETERGGFMGHPMCEFCEKPFYGENELFSHMSTEHYTCFICQRQHPGQHNYLRNYDDLETHFRQAHFLCEDEVCLEKKFVVFTSESEMKRHNALEHGGRMSRSKRSAALQIPISFQFRQVSQDRRGRGRRFHSESSDNQLSRAIQDIPGASDPPSSYETSASALPVLNGRVTNTFQSVGSFDLLTSLESEPSSVQHSQASSRPNSGSVPLEQASFPPLPVAKGKGKKKNTSVLGGSSRLHPQGNRSLTIHNTSLAWSTPHGPPNSLASFPRLSSVSNSGNLSSPSSYILPQSRPAAMNMNSSSSSFLSTVSAAKAKKDERSSSSSTATSSSRKLPTNGMVTQSAIALNHLNRGTFDDPVSNFPPVLGTQATTSGQTSAKGEDVNAANKSLVERIRLALLYDESRYTAFKEISSQFRHGIINTEEYLASVCQFGLSHLILELARLCPDPDKQRELVETYRFNTGSTELPENDPNKEGGRLKCKRSAKKGKEKCEENGISIPRDISADGVITGMKNLELRYTSVSDQAAKGKAKIMTSDDLRNGNANSTLESFLERHNSQNGSQTVHSSAKKSSVPTGGGHQKQQKTSKFLRNRLGSDAPSSFSEAGSLEPNEQKIEEDKDPPEGLPISGVWGNGGGRKLVAMTQKDFRKR